MHDDRSKNRLSPIAHYRSWARWSAAILSIFLSLAILHQVVPSAAHQDDCSLCRLLRAPSLPAATIDPIPTAPEYFETFPEADRRPLSLRAVSLEPLRGPPAPLPA